MTSPPPASNALTIQPGTLFFIDEYEVTVLEYKGQLTGQVWYFDVSFKPRKEEGRLQNGFIRVGATEAESGLVREVKLRAALGNYQMVAPILAQQEEDARVLAAEADADTEAEVNWDRSGEKAKAIAQSTSSSSTSVVVLDAEAIFTDGESKDSDADLSEAINSEAINSEAINSEENIEAHPNSLEEARKINTDILDDAASLSIEEIENEHQVVCSPSDGHVDQEKGPRLEQVSAETDNIPDENIPEGNTERTSTKETSAEDTISLAGVSSSSQPESATEKPTLDSDTEDYLEEEYYDEKDIAADSGGKKLILLSAYPEDSQTLDTWLQESHTQDENLSVLIQLCQFFRYLHQRDWCFVHLLPQFIQLSKPIQFYDLTGAYTAESTLTASLQGPYCAPELGYETATIQESLSSYAIGAVLHQLTYGTVFDASEAIDHDTKHTALKQIPRISQILNICLSPIPEDRFPLNQLLDVLLATRQALRAGTFTWEVAHRSTVGLSTARLQNEDSYGIRQQQLSNSQALMLGIMADGMGGMAEGDVASATAVKTLLEAPIPAEMTEDTQYAQWLEDIVQKANDAIAATVREGGTTLSAVLAINKTLTLAHVGDSRIYLLRGHTLRQISEDHSYVAMLVASGEITHEESLEHPERNMLIKSLGSKRQLMNGYIQNMTHWGSALSLELEDGDILLLCSDGVWDLVKDPELCETFTAKNSIQQSVNTIIDRVLERGASDNATLLALKFNHDTSRPD